MVANFDTLINDVRPVIVDFHAVWCNPCKMQTPILEELATELGEKIRIVKVDVDKNNEIAGRYNIQSIPTLMLFRNGEIKHKRAGIHSKAQLMELVLNNM